MRRAIGIALAVLVSMAALFGFSVGGSADVPKIPIKTKLILPLPTVAPTPTPLFKIKPHIPTKTFTIATPKPSLTKIPVFPHKTFPILVTLAPASTPMPGPADDPYTQLDALEVINLGTDTSLDLDGSGPMDIHLTWSTDAYGSGTYTLTAGSAHVTADCISLTYQLYFAKLAGASGAIYLIVPDYGESDDPVSYIYRYSGGSLHHVGDVPALPETFDIHGTVFTTTIRGTLLQTWFRPADFSVVPNAHEIRRDLYPMGTTVTLLRDLSLQASRTDTTTAITLHTGDHVVLATTDDIEWVNVIRAGHSSQGGWMHVSDQYYCDVGGEQVAPYDLFDGLVSAD